MLQHIFERYYIEKLWVVKFVLANSKRKHHIHHREHHLVKHTDDGELFLMLMSDFFM